MTAGVEKERKYTENPADLAKQLANDIRASHAYWESLNQAEPEALITTFENTPVLGKYLRIDQVESFLEVITDEPLSPEHKHCLLFYANYHNRKQAKQNLPYNIQQIQFNKTSASKKLLSDPNYLMAFYLWLTEQQGQATSSDASTSTRLWNMQICTFTDVDFTQEKKVSEEFKKLFLSEGAKTFHFDGCHFNANSVSQWFQGLAERPKASDDKKTLRFSNIVIDKPMAEMLGELVKVAHRCHIEFIDVSVKKEAKAILPRIFSKERIGKQSMLASLSFRATTENVDYPVINGILAQNPAVTRVVIGCVGNDEAAWKRTVAIYQNFAPSVSQLEHTQHEPVLLNIEACPLEKRSELKKLNNFMKHRKIISADDFLQAVTTLAKVINATGGSTASLDNDIAYNVESLDFWDNAVEKLLSLKVTIEQLDEYYKLAKVIFKHVIVAHFCKKRQSICGNWSETHRESGGPIFEYGVQYSVGNSWKTALNSTKVQRLVTELNYKKMSLDSLLDTVSEYSFKESSTELLILLNKKLPDCKSKMLTARQQLHIDKFTKLVASLDAIPLSSAFDEAAVSSRNKAADQAMVDCVRTSLLQLIAQGPRFENVIDGKNIPDRRLNSQEQEFYEWLTNNPYPNRDKLSNSIDIFLQHLCNNSEWSYREYIVSYLNGIVRKFRSVKCEPSHISFNARQRMKEIVRQYNTLADPMAIVQQLDSSMAKNVSLTIRDIGCDLSNVPRFESWEKTKDLADNLDEIIARIKQKIGHYKTELGKHRHAAQHATRVEIERKRKTGPCAMDLGYPRCSGCSNGHVGYDEKKVTKPDHDSRARSAAKIPRLEQALKKIQSALDGINNYHDILKAIKAGLQPDNWVGAIKSFPMFDDIEKNSIKTIELDDNCIKLVRWEGQFLMIEVSDLIEYILNTAVKIHQLAEQHIKEVKNTKFSADADKLKAYDEMTKNFAAEYVGKLDSTFIGIMERLKNSGEEPAKYAEEYLDQYRTRAEKLGLLLYPMTASESSATASSCDAEAHGSSSSQVSYLGGVEPSAPPASPRKGGAEAVVEPSAPEFVKAGAGSDITGVHSEKVGHVDVVPSAPPASPRKDGAEAVVEPSAPEFVKAGVGSDITGVHSEKIGHVGAVPSAPPLEQDNPHIDASTSSGEKNKIQQLIEECEDEGIDLENIELLAEYKCATCQGINDEPVTHEQEIGWVLHKPCAKTWFEKKRSEDCQTAYSPVTNNKLDVNGKLIPADLVRNLIIRDLKIVLRDARAEKQEKLQAQAEESRSTESNGKEEAKLDNTGVLVAVPETLATVASDPDLSTAGSSQTEFFAQAGDIHPAQGEQAAAASAKLQDNEVVTDSGKTAEAAESAVSLNSFPPAPGVVNVNGEALAFPIAPTTELQSVEDRSVEPQLNKEAAMPAPG